MVIVNNQSQLLLQPTYSRNVQQFNNYIFIKDVPS